MRFVASILLLGIGACTTGTGQSQDPVFIGQRHLAAGPFGGSVSPPDCGDMEDSKAAPGQVCVDQGLPALTANYAQAVGSVVVAIVDVDTAKYAELGGEPLACPIREGEEGAEDATFVPYAMFEPEAWIKGDGSDVKTVGFQGECRGMGVQGQCNILQTGTWYLSYGRNLLFLAEDCCLSQALPGAKAVVAAYPIEGDKVFDAAGKAWPVAEVLAAVEKAAADREPSKTIGGKGFYEWDVPCSEK